MTVFEGRLRLAELLASLSLATDLGTGQPLGHGLRTCLLAVSLAREMGCDADQVRSVHRVSLLRFLGCTSDAAEVARMAGGDELTFNAVMAPVVYGGTGETLRALVSAVGAGKHRARKARLVVGALADPGSGARSLTAHCEVASMLARRLHLEQPVIEALSHAYERWDGSGYPAGLEGEAIPLEIRISTVARDVDLLLGQGQDPLRALSRRRSRTYDPEVVDAYRRWRGWRPEADWAKVMEAEPGPVAYVEDLDQAMAAMADFVDLKSPWTRGHSPRVADLAGGGALEAGLGGKEVENLRRAALLHDLGRVGVENGIWDKAGRLSTDEWEKVRLHPYLTHRVLSRCPALAPLAEIAASHHERLNGSGYHRQHTAESLSVPARLLAAADALAALTSARPHRPALDLDQAMGVLREEARAGRLDREVVTAVVTVAGGEMEGPRPANPGGLSDREVEVLRLLARGLTNREVGETLFISVKTVGRHVENIYGKIGVSTRAGAAVYAMEHRLLG
jgi:HD-GYP domain-containing protein (c-di-GMP phosphodiesterase class II)